MASQAVIVVTIEDDGKVTMNSGGVGKDSKDAEEMAEMIMRAAFEIASLSNKLSGTIEKPDASGQWEVVKEVE